MSVQAFQAALFRRCKVECMATQDAIEALAAEFGGPEFGERSRRRRLFEFLEQAAQQGERGRTDLFDLIMVAWARAPLKRATGLDRDQWIRVFDTSAKLHHTGGILR